MVAVVFQKEIKVVIAVICQQKQILVFVFAHRGGKVDGGVVVTKNM